MGFWKMSLKWNDSQELWEMKILQLWLKVQCILSLGTVFALCMIHSANTIEYDIEYEYAVVKRFQQM